MGPDLLTKPNAETSCPAGNHTLRHKQLINLKFCDNKEGEKSNKYQCWVCSRTLTNTNKSAALKTCGHVMCVTCLDKLKKDKACPQCSKQYTEKDIINIACGEMRELLHTR